MNVLDEIMDWVMSRIRGDQTFVGRRYAQMLPYHAVVTVTYDLQEVVEALWTSRNDYSFREMRTEGVLVEMLEYTIMYPTDAGLARIPVSVQMGDDLEVVVEYEDLAGYVIELMNSRSN